MLPIATAPHSSNFNHASSEDSRFKSLLKLDAETGKPTNAYFYSTFAETRESNRDQIDALIHLAAMPPKERASLPIFESASENYVKAITLGMRDILRANPYSDSEKAYRGKIFLYLISSSQNEQLPAVIKDLLLQTIYTLNEEKAFNSLDLHDANLNGLNLSGLNLRYSNLSCANLYNATLNDTNLSNVNLSKAFLPYVDLAGANLTGANLILATLTEVSLLKATLVYANLSGAMLNQANLTGANLTGVNLGNADLNRANLTNANLSKAFMKDTNLKYTNQTGTILTDVIKYHPVKEHNPPRFWGVGKHKN